MISSQPNRRHQRALAIGTTTTGTVVQWRSEQGYGFIGTPDRADVFVHVSELPDRDWLIIGEVVRFTVAADRDGRLCAKQVTVLEGDSGG